MVFLRLKIRQKNKSENMKDLKENGLMAMSIPIFDVILRQNNKNL